MSVAPRGGLATAVVIPCLNEEESIGRVVADIPRDLVTQIIVVDNCSTDRTAEVAAAAGATVVREGRPGYGRACLTGVRAAGEVDVIALMDGDYSDYPDELPRLLQPIAEGRADLVIGSRTRGHVEEGALTPQQRFGNWLTARLMLLLYGLRVSDLGPFRAIRRQCLARLNMTEMTYGWSVEMMVKSARMGYRIVEVPVNYRRRFGGVSKVGGNLLGSVKAGYRILATTFRCLRWKPED